MASLWRKSLHRLSFVCRVRPVGSRQPGHVVLTYGALSPAAAAGAGGSAALDLEEEEAEAAARPDEAAFAFAFAAGFFAEAFFAAQISSGSSSSSCRQRSVGSSSSPSAKPPSSSKKRASRCLRPLAPARALPGSLIHIPPTNSFTSSRMNRLWLART